MKELGIANDKIFTMEKRFNEDGEVSIFVMTNLELIKRGLLKEISGNQLKVLMAIVSFMDDRGECFPSQETIAELTGVAISTVALAINSLVKVKVGRKTLLTRKLVGGGAKKTSYYSFPLLNDQTEKSDVEDRLTAPAVLKLFTDKYEEYYGKPYKPNYVVDMSKIKKTLMPVFNDDQIKIIINLTIEEYDKRWSSPQYPSPTIGAMCGWIAQNVIKIHADRTKVKVDRYARLTNDEDLVL